MSKATGLGPIARRPAETVHVRAGGGRALCGAEKIGVMGVWPEERERSSCPKCAKVKAWAVTVHATVKTPIAKEYNRIRGELKKRKR